MNLTRITYTGRKVYRDKLSGNTWEPGDTKLVTEGQASKLLRFAEFKPFSKQVQKEAERMQEQEPTQDLVQTQEPEQAPTDAEIEAAMVVQNEAERAQEQEREQQEAMLLTVESMDKAALEEYARKYEVELDKRLGVGKLRAEVANLVEQFGAR